DVDVDIDLTTVLVLGVIRHCRGADTSQYEGSGRSGGSTYPGTSCLHHFSIPRPASQPHRALRLPVSPAFHVFSSVSTIATGSPMANSVPAEIGRASCRERG